MHLISFLSKPSSEGIMLDLITLSNANSGPYFLIELNIVTIESISKAGPIFLKVRTPRGVSSPRLGASPGVKNLTSGMPGFENVLTDEQIWEFLAFIRSTWPMHIKDAHATRHQFASE